MKQFISLRTGENMAEAFLIWRVLSLSFTGEMTRWDQETPLEDDEYVPGRSTRAPHLPWKSEGKRTAYAARNLMSLQTKRQTVTLNCYPRY